MIETIIGIIYVVGFFLGWVIWGAIRQHEGRTDEELETLEFTMMIFWPLTIIVFILYVACAISADIGSYLYIRATTKK